MCLAVPVKINKIKDNIAEIENGKKVKLSLIANAQVGEYLLVHGNLAVNKLTEFEAQKIFNLIKNCSHQH